MLFVCLYFYLLLYHFSGSGGVAGEGGGDLEGEESVSALGGAVLNDIFPQLFVFVFRIFVQGLRVAKSIVWSRRTRSRCELLLLRR